MFLNEQTGSIPGIGIYVLSKDLSDTKKKKNKKRTPLEFSKINTIEEKQSVHNMISIYFQKLINYKNQDHNTETNNLLSNQ